MLQLFLSAALTLAGPAAASIAAPPDVPFTVHARLADGPLTAGTTATVELTVTLGDGWSASEAGIPKPILQIDVPKGIVLAGKRLEGKRELAANEFLQAPFERLVDLGATSIGFTVAEAPAADAALGLNVVAYVRKTEGRPDEQYFLRRRVNVPLTPGAVGVPGDTSQTSWGDESGTELDVGDSAPMFVVPRADGKMLQLAALRGRHNIIVTTYRAFW